MSVGLVLNLVASVCSAWALDVPPLTGRIVDRARIMPADVTASLTNELAAHEAATGHQVAVLILPSLEGEPLEPFAHRVATDWALGQTGADNGVLLLVALRERKVRIEVGYGLEGILTDLRASRIIRTVIVPRFRAGDFPGGIVEGARAVLRTIEGAEAAAPAPPQAHPMSAVEYAFIGIVVGTLAGLVLSQGLQRTRALFGSLLAFLIAQIGSLVLGIAAGVVTAFLLMALMHAGRGGGRRVGWGPVVPWPGGRLGGGFGGGFGGGGGSFGGGGASGDW